MWLILAVWRNNGMLFLFGLYRTSSCEGFEVKIAQLVQCHRSQIINKRTCFPPFCNGFTFYWHFIKWKFEYTLFATAVPRFWSGDPTLRILPVRWMGIRLQVWWMEIRPQVWQMGICPQCSVWKSVPECCGWKSVPKLDRWESVPNSTDFNLSPVWWMEIGLQVWWMEIRP